MSFKYSFPLFKNLYLLKITTINMLKLSILKWRNWARELEIKVFVLPKADPGSVSSTARSLEHCWKWLTDNWTEFSTRTTDCGQNYTLQLKKMQELPILIFVLLKRVWSWRLGFGVTWRLKWPLSIKLSTVLSIYTEWILIAPLSVTHDATLISSSLKPGTSQLNKSTTCWNGTIKKIAEHLDQGYNHLTSPVNTFVHVTPALCES